MARQYVIRFIGDNPTKAWDAAKKVYGMGVKGKASGNYKTKNGKTKWYVEIYVPLYLMRKIIK